MKAISFVVTRTLALGLALWLTGCATGPQVNTDALDQAAVVPSKLAVSEGEALRVEPILKSGPNRPYKMDGKTYEPLVEDVPWRETGQASWYAKKFHGRKTASGEMYSMFGYTAAHRTLPIPSYAKIKNLKNGKSVIVRINDRGPFHSSRIIDVSYVAAQKLGMVASGLANVEVIRLTFDEIERGAWRVGGDDSEDDQASVASLSLAERGAAEDVPEGERSKAHTPHQRGFYVQLAALRDRRGVERLQQQVADELANLTPLLAVFHEKSLYKLKVGPYANRLDAVEAAGEAREALRLQPLLVERR